MSKLHLQQLTTKILDFHRNFFDYLYRVVQKPKSSYVVDEKLVEEKIKLFEKLINPSEWCKNSDKDGVFVASYESNDNYTGAYGEVKCPGTFEGLMDISGIP